LLLQMFILYGNQENDSENLSWMCSLSKHPLKNCSSSERERNRETKREEKKKDAAAYVCVQVAAGWRAKPSHYDVL